MIDARRRRAFGSRRCAPANRRGAVMRARHRLGARSYEPQGQSRRRCILEGGIVFTFWCDGRAAVLAEHLPLTAAREL
jgi:hypothetical protein